MLNKLVIALAAFLFGTAVTHHVHSRRAENFRKIALIESEEFEQAGFERGWEAAANSGWLYIRHVNEFQKATQEAEARQS